MNNLKQLSIVITTLLLLLGCGSETTNYVENFYTEEAPMGAMVDGWSKVGFLGMGGAAVPDPNGKASNARLEMQAKFSKEEGGPGAQYFTVQFGVNRPPGGVFDPQAEIQWSVNGTDVRRVVSVGNGTVVSGTAETVKVTLTDVTDISVFTAEAYLASILVTQGTRPSVQQPPRLDAGNITIPAGGTVIVGIPTDAGVISVNTQVILNPVGPINEFDIVATFLEQLAFIAGYDPADIPAEWVPVPTVADAIQFDNTTADDCIIYLRWGIEG